jgi:hypothetical protein
MRQRCNVIAVRTYVSDTDPRTLSLKSEDTMMLFVRLAVRVESRYSSAIGRYSIRSHATIITHMPSKSMTYHRDTNVISRVTS